MGLCPQFDTVWPTLTVQEHLLLYARLKGIPMESESAAAQWVAAQVELDGDAYYQPASQLSGGMRRRLSLGIALVGNPKIVFLDEPTTGLHFEDISKLLMSFEKLRDNNSTVIVIEHNKDIIINSDYIVDLGPGGGDYGGEIVYQGEPKGLKKTKSLTGKYL